MVYPRFLREVLLLGAKLRTPLVRVPGPALGRFE